MGTITSKIKHVAENIGVFPLRHDGTDDEIIEKVSKQNAIEGVQEILSLSPYLADKVRKGELGIVSAYHDISTGEVNFDHMVSGTYSDVSSM
jgi:carbonic anhydrase